MGQSLTNVLAACLLFSTFSVTVFGQGESRDQTLSRLSTELHTGTDDARKKAALELSRLGGDGVPALVAALQVNKNAQVLSEISAALCRTDKPAVRPLINLLNENLKTRDVLVLRHSANVLACIAEASTHDMSDLYSVVPILIQALENDKQAHLLAMSVFKTEEKEPTIELEAINERWQGFDAAAHCLGRIGKGSKDAVPLLMEIAGNEVNRDDPYPKADSIKLILTDLIRASDTSANAQIREAFAKYGPTLLEKDRTSIEAKISALNSIEVSQQIVSTHPMYWGFGLAAALLLAFLIAYLLKPHWLIYVNEFVSGGDVRLTGVLGTLALPLDYIVAPLVLRPRALDAWVNKHLPRASQAFANTPTVKDRRIYVPVGLFLDGRLQETFDSRTLKPTFDRNQSRLLIVGDGGAGKTSLACQVSQWAMSEKKEERLCARHRMMPVLLEHDFANGGDDALKRSISSHLYDLLDLKKPISDSLLKSLLRNKRLLVVTDGMSEMTEETRAAVLSGISRIPVNALIITSRTTEPLDQLRKTTVRPTRIRGNQLSSFVESYLSSLGKKQLFEDEDFFEDCRLLSGIVGDRDITALLARLFVEQMVARQEKTISKDLPDNIPDLMLQSIQVLYAKSPSPKPALRDVLSAATAIAWECLRGDFRPLPVDYDYVKRALSNYPNGEQCLSYLKDNLRLVEATSFDRKIRFGIDPLAEYLAGAYLVEQNKEDGIKWDAFLVSVDSRSRTHIKGFLFAVLDCCEIASTFTVPGFVFERLSAFVADND